jgi:hypothetical protein
MKKWMASSAAKQAKIAKRNKSDRHAERAGSRMMRKRSSLKQSGSRARLPLTALRSRMVAKPAHTPTDGDKIRNEFAEWSTSKLKTYAKEHDLFTKTQFCNSRSVAHNPTFTELQRAFGPDWRDVPPRVASLAAVNSCMEALGLRARQSRPADIWDHGPLKGEADNVRECALGVSKVLSPFALCALCCFGFVSCHSILSATNLFWHFFVSCHSILSHTFILICGCSREGVPSCYQLYLQVERRKQHADPSAELLDACNFMSCYLCSVCRRASI